MAGPFNITPQSLASNLLTGLSLLSGATRTDVIGFANQETFEQAFVGAEPMDAKVHETSKVMDYPVETGAILSDHHVINPIGIDVVVFISSENYASTYQEIRAAYLAATALTVQTRTGIYRNMIVAAMPHSEDAEMFDAINMFLSMREVQFVVPSSASQPSNYKPRDPAMSSTVSRGLQISKTALTSGLGAASYLRLASVWGLR